MSLRRWWTDKYKLPSTHEAFQNATIEDLLVEYYEDYFDANPSEARKEQSDEDGEFYFTNTGDPYVDKWERELAAGIVPDLTEGMSEQAKEELRKEREAIERAKGFSGMIEEPEPTENLPFDSKFVPVGSDEEAELLKGRKDGEWTDLLAFGE